MMIVLRFLDKSRIVEKEYQKEDRDSGLLFSLSFFHSINKRDKTRKK